MYSSKYLAPLHYYYRPAATCHHHTSPCFTSSSIGWRAPTFFASSTFESTSIGESMPFFYSTLYSSIQIESGSFPYRKRGPSQSWGIQKKKSIQVCISSKVNLSILSRRSQIQNPINLYANRPGYKVAPTIHHMQPLFLVVTMLSFLLAVAGSKFTQRAMCMGVCGVCTWVSYASVRQQWQNMMLITVPSLCWSR